MEIKLLILIILLIMILSICSIVIFGLVFKGKFAAMAKEVCLMTVGKLFANPTVCEVFIV
jgi:hypothetical protein